MYRDYFLRCEVRGSGVLRDSGHLCLLFTTGENGPKWSGMRDALVVARDWVRGGCLIEASTVSLRVDTYRDGRRVTRYHDVGELFAGSKACNDLLAYTYGG